MARLLAPVLALSIALGLTACGGEKKQAGAGKAEGEVLPGSASDAMLPLDTVKSQAPLAPHSEGSSKAAGKGADAADKAAPSRAEPEKAAELAAPPEPVSEE